MTVIMMLWNLIVIRYYGITDCEIRQEFHITLLRITESDRITVIRYYGMENDRNSSLRFTLHDRNTILRYRPPGDASCPPPSGLTPVPSVFAESYAFWIQFDCPIQLRFADPTSVCPYSVIKLIFSQWLAVTMW